MRRPVTAFLLTTVATFFLFSLVPAQAAWNLAQEDTTTEDTSGGSGQDDEGAETGADEGSTAEGESTEEEGPPWTYQMARIGMVLLLLVALLLARWYYKMIVVRQRGEA